MSNSKIDWQNMYAEIFSGMRVVTPLSHEDITSRYLADNDIFILDNPDTAYDIVRNIRLTDHPIYCMRPVFLAPGVKVDSSVIVHIDGEITLENASGLKDKVNIIQSRMNLVSQEIIKMTYEDNLILKVLRFMFSRSINLNSVTTRKTKSGYVYPIASLFYSEDEQQKIFINLDNAFIKGYLKRELLIDKIHLCQDCHGSFLNYREICPKCRSVDLISEDIIHHFKCAHVAPLSHFAKQRQLICPKCDSILRHIGIDYDKPSVLYTCNSCSHSFQDPNMEAYCLDCHKRNDLYELSLYQLYEYSLSAKGEQASRNGFMPSEDRNVGKNKNIIDYDMLNFMLQREISRVKLHKTSGYFALVRMFQNVIPAMNVKRGEEFMHEVAEIISGYTEDIDIISPKDYLSYYLIFPDNTLEMAFEKMDMIKFNLEKLMSDNFLIEEDFMVISFEELALTPSIDSVWEAARFTKEAYEAVKNKKK